MDKKLVRRIAEHFARGDKVLFGFDHFGAVRVKVKHGPFNLFTTHLQTDQETFNAIQAWLSNDGGEDGQYSETPCQQDPHIAPVESEPERAAAPPSQELPETIWKEPRTAVAGSYGRISATAGDRMTDTPCLDVRSQLPRRDVYGTAQWYTSSKNYQRNNDQQRFEAQLDTQEIEAHRFALIDIDGAWRSMMLGETPKIASEIWRRMHPTKPVHEIANEAQIPLRECLFWLCVFKRHLDVWADTDGGTYTFHRGEDEPDLSAAVRMKMEPAR